MFEDWKWGERGGLKNFRLGVYYFGGYFCWEWGVSVPHYMPGMSIEIWYQSAKVDKSVCF